MLKKLFFLVCLLSGVLLAGCLHESSPQNLSNADGKSELVSGDASRLLLSLPETGFDAVESREYSSAEEVAGGSAGSAALFRDSGFTKGYRNSFTKVEETSYRKLVHDVYLFSSSKGAKLFFATLRESLQQLSGTVSPFQVPKLGDASLGVKGTRQVQAGEATAGVADYIIIFVKVNVVETLDYYGLEESLSVEEAVGLAQKAADKIS